MFMKYVLIFFIVALNPFITFKATAQNPEGFSRGTIMLGDSSTVTGLIKENIRKNASIILQDETGKKRTYSGNELVSLQQDSVFFICLRGDFFKVISDGEVKLLQKLSDASGKPSYNGTEAIFVNGTEGKPGNYFLYNSKKQLQLITRKTYNSIIEENLSAYTPALDKAKANPNDMNGLKGAVELYNNH
jgi:hypothetical protein